VQVLHSLPGREDGVALRRERAHDRDQHAESTQSPTAENPKSIFSYFTGDARQAARALHIAGDSQKPRRRLVESGRSGECGSVVDRGKIEQLIRVLPIENAFEFEHDDRRGPDQQLHEHPIENGCRRDRRQVESFLELSPEIEIAIASVGQLHEIHSVVRRDESQDPCVDGGVEQASLGVDDDIAKA